MFSDLILDQKVGGSSPSKRAIARFLLTRTELSHSLISQGLELPYKPESLNQLTIWGALASAIPHFACFSSPAVTAKVSS